MQQDSTITKENMTYDTFMDCVPPCLPLLRKPKILFRNESKTKYIPQKREEKKLASREELPQNIIKATTRKL